MWAEEAILLLNVGEQKRSESTGEVTSLSTVRVDRMEKFLEYARAGVREYWIVDPEARTVEVYVWRHGAYVLRGRWGPGEAASSELLPGF